MKQWMHNKWKSQVSSSQSIIHAYIMCNTLSEIYSRVQLVFAGNQIQITIALVKSLTTQVTACEQTVH